MAAPGSVSFLDRRAYEITTHAWNLRARWIGSWLITNATTPYLADGTWLRVTRDPIPETFDARAGNAVLAM